MAQRMGLDRIEGMLKDGMAREALPHLEAGSWGQEEVRARFLSGVAHKMIGDMAGAEADFRHVLAAHPNHDGALYGLGLVQEERGNLPEALSLWKEALRANPRHAGAARKIQERRPGARGAEPESAVRAARVRHLLQGSTPPLRQGPVFSPQHSHQYPQSYAPPPRPAPSSRRRSSTKRPGCGKTLVGVLLWLVWVGVGVVAGGAVGAALMGDGGFLVGGILGLIVFHIIWIPAARRWL